MLDKRQYREGGGYRFQLISPFSVKIDEFAGRVKFPFDFGVTEPGAVGEASWRVWGWLQPDGTLTIAESYAWDGCSPGMLVRDFLYQFLEDAVWAREEVDQVFDRLMKSAGLSDGSQESEPCDV